MLQRRRLQRLLADALEAVGGQRRGDVLRLATWRMESASPVDARLLMRAARGAREVFDFALAARLAGASWELAPSFEAGLLLGVSLSELGQFDSAGGILDRLAGTEPDGSARQLLARERAWVMFHGPGGLAEARRILEQAEASMDDPVRRLLARADLAKLLTYAGRLTEALAIGCPLITPGMDVRVRLRSLCPVAACMVFAGRAGRALAWCDELDAAAASLHEELPEAVGWVWAARTNALLLAGRLDEVTTVLAGPLEPGAAPIVGAGHLAYERTKLGRARLLQGRPASALGQLTEAAAVLRASEPVGCLAWCLSLAAEAHALLGHLADARRLAEEAMMRRASGFAVFDGDAARARAWVTAATGERSRAIDQLITAADDQENRGQPAFAIFALHDALRLGAEHVAGRLETLAASLDGPWPAAAVIHARAAYASDAASLEAAAESLEAAADAFAALGADLVAAEAAAEASGRWAASGHTARAAATHAKATRLSPREPGDALRFILPLAEAPGLATLTRRGREVAALAGHGLSNADIAGRLVVSIRTVVKPPLLRIRQARRVGSRCTRRRPRISVAENTAVRKDQ
jgi:hypothetical protein